MIKILTSEAETIKYAQELASGFNARDILFLRGDLGAGKTVFARSLIRTLTENNELEVPSPTFTLLQTYDSPLGSIWHFDLYRLEKPEDIYELGWEEALYEGLCIVEWPEKLKELTPPSYTNIEIRTSESLPSQRHITISKVEN